MAAAAAAAEKQKINNRAKKNQRQNICTNSIIQVAFLHSKSRDLFFHNLFNKSIEREQQF